MDTLEDHDPGSDISPVMHAHYFQGHRMVHYLIILEYFGGNLFLDRLYGRYSGRRMESKSPM